MTRQITCPRYAALDPALERVLTRHAALVDAATPNNDLISDHQRARVRRLMIALFRAAGDRRAMQYTSYSELPGHPDGPILGRSTLDRRRFVRITVSPDGHGFGLFWKWADEDFTPDRAIHARRNPLGYLPDRTELSISTDLSRARLHAVFHLIKAYTTAELPDREAAETFERTYRKLPSKPFSETLSLCLDAQLDAQS
jgi:hypothetical protein